jgi:hypothetical protein
MKIPGRLGQKRTHVGFCKRNGWKQTMNMSGSLYLDFTGRVLGGTESAMPTHWMKLFALAGLMACEKAWMPSATPDLAGELDEIRGAAHRPHWAKTLIGVEKGPRL